MPLKLMLLLVVILALTSPAQVWAADGTPVAKLSFPPSLESYNDAHLTSVWDILKNRAEKEPFNLIATALFLCAVIHTFFTHKFREWAHNFEKNEPPSDSPISMRQHLGAKLSPNVIGRIFHFLGEVEAVFGIWVIPLMLMMIWRVGLQESKDYLNLRVNFTEPIFVVVIMAIAATRPIMNISESFMSYFARTLGKDTPSAWWLCILSIGPLLGSLITEPAAMTICASLLGRKFYNRKPSPRLAYATLGLLFVNISVGGTLTHFAAPPVLMVANSWGWDTPFMFRHFGWIAVVGIIVSNGIYFAFFRKEMNALPQPEKVAHEGAKRDRQIPAWVTFLHVCFMAYAVLAAHYPVLLIGGFLMFLAVYQVTEDYQNAFDLRMPILVGFFLAGLVIHGTLQQWWIGPVLGHLGETPLLLGSIGLTAFNDNAAITYLASLVPNLSDGMKYAVVAGAVTGGGLTVIANAPNPAGQALLGRHFPNGIAPLYLFLGALLPTLIMAFFFILLH